MRKKQPNHPAFHSQFFRVVAAVAGATLLTSGFVAAAVLPASAASDQVSGTVFRDFNSNGTMDTAGGAGVAVDQGLGGVSVSAVDAVGTVFGPVQTAADGTYAIPVAGAASASLRVDFTGLPAGYESSFHGTGAGTTSGTSEQFVQKGASDVDYGVNAPADYSQSNPPLILPMQFSGLRTKNPAGSASIVSVPWNATPNETSNGTLTNYDQRTTLATVDQTGSLWGTAFQKSTGDVYAAAMLRRQAELGPLGLGGIYRISNSLNADGTVKTGQALEQWLDVTTLGVDVGTAPSAADRKLNAPRDPARDLEVYQNVGKVGIGGIAVSEDQKTLYFVNLFDRKLYAVDISDPSVAPTKATAIDLGLGDGQRPWAVSTHNGSVYVGYVDSGEVDPDLANMNFTVLSAPEATATTASWTPAIVDSLDYERGHPFANNSKSECTTSDSYGDQSRFCYWHPWTTDWDLTDFRFNDWGTSHAQPILSNLDFDTNGELVLGFMDRFSAQSGNDDWAPTGTSTSTWETVSNGDTLIAAPNGSGFTLESNGTVDGRTSSRAGNEQGPGGGEFFDDVYSNSHNEVTTGALSTMAGVAQVVTTAFDPLQSVRINGLKWLSTTDGDTESGYQLQGDPRAGNSGAPGSFQKAGGLGDLQRLSNEAPVEIGNRVWFDANHDGIQGADEHGVAGAAVVLKDANGTTVATKTTDANGEYYFGPADGLLPGTDYTLAFDYSHVLDSSNHNTFFPSGTSVGQLSWTTQTAGGDTAIDSNPDASTGVASVTTGAPGQNDHSYDAGLALVTPGVSIQKGDGDGTDITHEADTMAAGEVYAPGESREIVFSPTNSGTEALKDVSVTDKTISGGTVTAMSCVFPGEADATDGALVSGTWTVSWAASSGATPTASWAPDSSFSCTATLTVALGDQPHADSAIVSGTGVGSGKTVTDENPYNAFSGAIQVIKYDGQKSDPAVKNGGDWAVPAKPLADPAQDANSTLTAVDEPVDKAEPVRWVVSNTGTTWLTDLTLADVTNAGPSIAAGWVCDLTPIGGPADYDFVTDGPWTGGLFAPSASFFCEGQLTLPASSTHADTVTVVGTIVVPAVDGSGKPTGQPSEDSDHEPVRALADNGAPATVTDNDPFNAKTGTGPIVGIVKGDGENGVIANDADTMGDGQFYSPGEHRDIVFTPTNSGSEALKDVVVTDNTVSGATVSGMQCVFPGETTPTQGALVNGEWTVTWAASSGSTPATWAPGTSFDCSASLTVQRGDQPHVNDATVTGTGVASGTKVTDENPYNAFSGAIQVIKYDGQKSDPAVKNGNDWVIPAKPLADAAQDANTTASAVDEPVNTAEPVRWVVTNTGTTWLTDLTLADVTSVGPAIAAGWVCDLTPIGGPAGYDFVTDGPWTGGLFAPSASFFCEGDLTLPASSLHTDSVTVVGTVVVPEVDGDGKPTGQPSTGNDGPVRATDNNGAAVTVTDNDPFNAKTGVGPITTIDKGDGANGVIANEGDTMGDGQFYTPGESRDIVFTPANAGSEALNNVVVTDETISGATVTGMQCVFPGESSATQGVLAGGVWTVTWAASTGSSPVFWNPGVSFGCTATLTVTLGDQPHANAASVSGQGKASGTKVSSEHDYNAFTGGIQVIKYDGQKADPAVSDGTNWVVPAKPLADAAQDANTENLAVEYPVTTPKPVRWVVTNTGTTWLTNLTLADATGKGPDIAADWICDLTPFGGPADYSFVTDGPWTGGLLPPHASFFCEGSLTLPASTQHEDTVTVVGTVVVPAVDGNGVPTDQPAKDGDGNPVVATKNGQPVTVTDNDPFNAKTDIGPIVNIQKGDGSNGTIVNEADTMLDGQAYTPGEKRDIVFTPTNTGSETLKNVTVTDDTISGGTIDAMQCTFPGHDTPTAGVQDGKGWTVTWAESFGVGQAAPTESWLRDVSFDCSATLTVALSDAPHVNDAFVSGTGIGSGITVTDDNPYNAFTGGIQVIKYDGGKADPAVKNGDEWITPAKPLADAAQDANTADHAAAYEINAKNAVRWVVTNTGTTWLTNLSLADVTSDGPSVADWTCDLSPIGGPASYSFASSGAWIDGLFGPGQSFFCEGSLLLGADATHADDVTGTATVVVPAVDDNGKPTGEPQKDSDGKPVVAQQDGKPFTVTDHDPFHAKTPIVGALPNTGLAGVGALVLLGLLLLAGGAALVVLRRRTRRALG